MNTIHADRHFNRQTIDFWDFILFFSCDRPAGLIEKYVHIFACPDSPRVLAWGL